jgi:hypothetical protein
MNITYSQANLPPIIYKYRDWTNNKHKRIISEREIYFANPYDCDEQYECNLPTDYDSVGKEDLYQYFVQTAPDYGYIAEKDKHEIAKKMITESPFNSIEHRIRSEKLMRTELNERLSVFCTSEHKDSLHLWNVFGANQTGFCVGINTLKMFNKSESFAACAKVDYYPIGTPPMIKPFSLTEKEKLEKMLRIIYSLPDIYSNEDEFRFSKINIIKREVILPEECFEEIILGEKMDSKHEKEIINLIKINLPKCRIYKCKYDKHGFKFDLISIH